MALEMEQRDLSPAGWGLCLEMLRLMGDNYTWGLRLMGDSCTWGWRLTGDSCTWGWGLTDGSCAGGVSGFYPMAFLSPPK